MHRISLLYGPGQIHISLVSSHLRFSMSTPASSPTAFTSLVLGRSVNAIELLVPPAPAVQAATGLKARCYDFLADLLVEHSTLYSYAELIAAFAHIPTSSFNASLEATNICCSVRCSFFSIHHLVLLGFRDNLGAPISTAITPSQIRLVRLNPTSCMLVLDFSQNYYLQWLSVYQGFWSLKLINSKITLHSNMLLLSTIFLLFYPTPCFSAE
jgi:hypothetical protein